MNRTGGPSWEDHDPEVQYRNLPDAPWQPSPGFQGVREWFDFVHEVGEKFRFDMDEISDLGPDRVLAVGRMWMRFRASGIETEMPIAHVFKLRAGKVLRIDSYHSREDALRATPDA